jgi:cell division protein FtsZ
MQAAESGIAELAKYVDTLIVIPNQNLFRIATEETTFTDAFAMADRVLYSGVASITDLMPKKGLINLDFADVKKIMQGMGKAMMGSGEASGENRGLVAAETAISNPLLDDVSIRGARGLLISVVGGSDMKLYEVDAAVNRIREEIDPAANIIFGSIYDDSLDGTIRVSVVATGFANVNSAGMGNAESSSGLGLAELLAGMQPASGARESIFEPGGFQPSPPVDDPVVTTPDGVNIQHGLPHKVQSQPTSAAPEPGYQQPQFMPSAPEVVARPARRMPKPEEFPIVGQKAMQYAEGVMPEEGLHAHKKKIGFFGRLAAGMDAVNGHGSHETVPAGDRMEPEFSNRQQPPPAAGPNRQTYGYENNVNTMMQDEHVELPAFLRRKSVG